MLLKSINQYFFIFFKNILFLFSSLQTQTKTIFICNSFRLDDQIPNTFGLERVYIYLKEKARVILIIYI